MEDQLDSMDAKSLIKLLSSILNKLSKKTDPDSVELIDEFKSQVSNLQTSHTSKRKIPNITTSNRYDVLTDEDSSDNEMDDNTEAPQSDKSELRFPLANPDKIPTPSAKKHKISPPSPNQTKQKAPTSPQANSSQTPSNRNPGQSTSAGVKSDFIPPITVKNKASCHKLERLKIKLI